MSLLRNKIFQKLQKKESIKFKKELDIKILKTVSEYEAFHFSSKDIINFFQNNLEECRKRINFNTQNLKEKNLKTFITGGIVLKNNSKMYFTDFVTTREILFKCDNDKVFECDNEIVYNGKIIFAEVEMDNENYDLLHVKKILKTNNSKISKIEDSFDFKIGIIRGPFSENYWNDFIDKCDVYILIGPINKIGDQDPFDTNILREITSKFNKSFLLFPGYDDNIGDFLFPQTNIEVLNDIKNLYIMSNPSEFSINGLRFCFINNRQIDAFLESLDDKKNINNHIDEVFSNKNCVNILTNENINYSDFNCLTHLENSQVYITSSHMKNSIIKTPMNKYFINLKGKRHHIHSLFFRLKTDNENKLNISELE